MRVELTLAAVMTIILATILLGCGADFNTRSMLRGPVISDPTLVALVDEFLDEAQEQGFTGGRLLEMTEISYGDVGTKLGICSIGPTTRWVTISSTITKVHLKTTVWHELGHCLYDMPHHPEPGHIMSPMLGGHEYDANLPTFWESVPDSHRINE